MARVAVSRRYDAILTPQDIRAVAVARGYRWCLCCGSWYHESAAEAHTYCGPRRKRRSKG